MKRKLFLLMTFLMALSTYAQTELKGRVVNSVTKDPVSGVLVTLIGQSRSVTTDSNGGFIFLATDAGDDILSLTSLNIKNKAIPVKLVADAQNEIDDIKVDVKDVASSRDIAGTINDDFLSDDDGSGQEISSMVVLSNDIFVNQSGYQFSSYRFRTRGYDRIYEAKYINGVSFNDQNRGVFNFASIGAMNDLTRNGDAVLYNNAGSFTYGSLGGSENINMRAGSYNKGGKLTMSYTNRNYYLRGMASYSTGLLDNGWAVTALLGGRYSDEGNVDGTFYSNISYALAIEKQFNGGQHSLSFTTFGSPVKRGQQSASVQEAYDLTGDNLYNPNWGYQNGKKRNAKVVTAYDPTAILSHIWKIDDKTKLTTGVGYHLGKYSNTALNWYNAPDPRPDYYRNLPSYRVAEDDIALYTEAWKNNDASVTQINWDQMFQRNADEVREGKNTLYGQSALYMVEERHSDLMETSANTVLNRITSDNHSWTLGAGFRHSRSKQYKTVKDLLGAPYVRDIDKYAERDFPTDETTMQNDLRNPNKLATEGDVFGYDYRLNINSANVWLHDKYTTRHFDYYYATKLTYTDFYRLGKMQNGRYINESYGKGTTHTFIDYALKGGITYKISGRHYLSANVSFQTDAPLPNMAYISPRISDRTPDLESGKIVSADLNYVFSLPSLVGRISVFQTNFYDQIKRNSYYFDSQNTFVNHILTGVDKIHRGFEVGLDYKINENWSVNFAGTMSQYYYDNNPTGTISSEDGRIENQRETVFLKDYAVGGTPQIMGTLGVAYFYDYWFINLNLNGAAQNYIDIAPIRRLASNYVSVVPGTSEYDAYKYLTHQERFGSATTLDLSIGKMLYLPKRQALNFNVSVNNILNRQNIKTGGYEQGRLDLSSKHKFDSKYFYMQGINCFVNVSYRF